MSKYGTMKEVLGFLRERRKYWLGPIIVMLILLGALLVFAESSVLGPFVYSFF